MSQLIQLQYPSPTPPQTLSLILKSTLRSAEMGYTWHTQQYSPHFSIRFFLKPTPKTYRLATIWKFQFLGTKFMIEILFYNREQGDLLRAYNQRMKIEIAILCRIVNRDVVPSFSFNVDCDTGLFKMTYAVDAHVIFSMNLKKENIMFLVLNLFVQMRRYDQLMMFIQPIPNLKQSQKEKDPHIRVNKFRAMLKSTRNTRRQIQACFNDLIRNKQSNREFNAQSLTQISNLYLKNVSSFQKSTIGLDSINEYQLDFDPNIFASQLKEVKKNQIGFTYQKNTSSQKAFGDKIILGLWKVQADKNGVETVCSQEGAHSSVCRNLFKYVVVDSIYKGTIDYQYQSNRMNFINSLKEVTGQLTYKICNTANQSSINSFKNQLHTLTYMKQMSSPFIARYYLAVKQSWDQNDRIYMNNYKHDVHNLLKSSNRYGIKKKLQLAYKIAKGLCFLYSKDIVHRDFKPRNILVDANLCPKIIDYGSSISQYMKNKFKVHQQRVLTTQGYNIQYLLIPPSNHQLLQKYTKSEYDEHPLFDVHGFGCTLSYIFFSDIRPPHIEDLLLEPDFQVLEHLVFLIQMCISIDPDDRPGFGELTAFIGALGEMVKEDVGMIQEEGVEGNQDSQSETREMKSEGTY